MIRDGHTPREIVSLADDLGAIVLDQDDLATIVGRPDDRRTGLRSHSHTVNYAPP
jgi:hypothetical protein